MKNLHKTNEGKGNFYHRGVTLWPTQSLGSYFTWQLSSRESMTSRRVSDERLCLKKLSVQSGVCII